MGRHNKKGRRDKEEAKQGGGCKYEEGEDEKAKEGEMKQEKGEGENKKPREAKERGEG